MWTYVHREFFFTIFGQCINVLNYKTDYAASNSPATLEFYINSDLARLSQWFDDNYLTINATKTQAMIVGKATYNYEFVLKSTNIRIGDELKLLGVTIDNKLTFSQHIKLVFSKFMLR